MRTNVAMIATPGNTVAGCFRSACDEIFSVKLEEIAPAEARASAQGLKEGQALVFMRAMILAPDVHQSGADGSDPAGEAITPRWLGRCNVLPWQGIRAPENDRRKRGSGIRNASLGRRLAPGTFDAGAGHWNFSKCSRSLSTWSDPGFLIFPQTSRDRYM